MNEYNNILKTVLAFKLIITTETINASKPQESWDIFNRSNAEST